MASLENGGKGSHIYPKKTRSGLENQRYNGGGGAVNRGAVLGETTVLLMLTKH